MNQSTPQNRQKLFHNRSSAGQFLLNKTDSNLKEGSFDQTPSNVLDELSEVFPEILSGKSFIDSAMGLLEPSPEFGAMAIRIDNFDSQTNKTPHAAETRIDVAKTLDALCKSENALWGPLGPDIFGCFFPGKNGSFCLETAEKIRTNLVERSPRTVSIGIAAYPAITFLKDQILENAHKALDHAAFFGDGSTVSFDAVSLNISGDQLYQKGDISGAVEEFKSALELDPSNVNVHNSLGVCYGALGSFEKALEEFETAMRLDPAEVMAVHNAGLSHLLMGNKDKALELFLRANQIGEDVFEVAFQTGRLYVEMGKPEAGKPYIEKAAALRPDSGPAFRYLGECYASTGMTNEAVVAYKKAVKQNPNDAASLSALGYLFDLQGENPEIAAVFCRQSIEISPEEGLFRHRLGRLYLKQSRFEEALKEFQQAIKLGHDSMEFVQKIQDMIISKAS